LIFDPTETGRPVWPPRFGLLSPEWLHLPRSEWTAEHWQHYALLLENAGHALVAEIDRARLEAAEVKRKASRRKNAPAQGVAPMGLLDALDAMAPKKAGRPKGSGATEKRAAKALAIRNAARTKGGRMTNKQAALLMAQEESPRQPPKPIELRAVCNAMSKMDPERRNHKNRRW